MSQVDDIELPKQTDDRKLDERENDENDCVEFADAIGDETEDQQSNNSNEDKVNVGSYPLRPFYRFALWE